MKIEERVRPLQKTKFKSGDIVELIFPPHNSNLEYETPYTVERITQMNIGGSIIECITVKEYPGIYHRADKFVLKYERYE